MFDDIFGFSKETFGAIILTTALAVSVHICHGTGTRRARDSFVGGLLLLVACVQLYYLILAAVHVPVWPYMYNDRIMRRDCMQSGKGGKRPDAATMPYDINPCFCNQYAHCILVADNSIIPSSVKCPTDGSAVCLRIADNISIPLYIDSERNCRGGALALCSKEQPCDPCDRNLLPSHSSGRCRSCFTDFKGRKI